MRYHLYLLECLLSKIPKMTSVGEDVEEKEHLGAVSENVIGSGTMENIMKLLQKVKNITII